MSDCLPGLIQIGGPIPRSLVPELLTRIKDEGLRWDWCGDAVSATTPEELLEELQRHNCETLNVGDDAALGGAFPELEEFLVRQGIAFNRHSDAKYEYDGEVVFFRYGMEGPGWVRATQDGQPVVLLDGLRPVQALLRQADHQQALAELNELLDAIPPLPPLCIQEAHDRSAARGPAPIGGGTRWANRSCR
jgi:hypothetical protein